MCLLSLFPEKGEQNAKKKVFFQVNSEIGPHFQIFWGQGSGPQACEGQKSLPFKC